MSIILREEFLKGISLKVQEVLEINQELSLNEELSNWGLDSMKSVALVVDLEEHFNITFDDDELLFEHFSTIQKIADRVAGKMEKTNDIS